MSVKAAAIADWLNCCNDGNDVVGDSASSCHDVSRTSSRQTKRKHRDMEEHTPRAKRVAIGVLTPSASDRDDVRMRGSGHHNTPSLRSSTTTSRSSSPSKRRREADIEFSKPAFDFYSRSDSRQWKHRRGSDIPLLKSLLESLATKDYEANITSQIRTSLDKISREIERCRERAATEEEWSDAVVLRALRVAKKLSSHQEGTEIINVKSIDVWPPTLLPTNEQTQSVSKKRVDYTVGLEIGSRDEVKTILQNTSDHTVVQTNHKLLRDRALCSYLEIKTERSQDDPRYQLCVWCAAGFQKQENIWLQRHSSPEQPPIPRLAPIPLWSWKERQVQLWIAIMDSENARVHMLDERSFAIDEDDPASLERVIGAMSAVIDWGQTHYRPWFRNLVGCHSEQEHDGISQEDNQPIQEDRARPNYDS